MSLNNFKSTIQQQIPYLKLDEAGINTQQQKAIEDIRQKLPLQPGSQDYILLKNMELQIIYIGYANQLGAFDGLGRLLNVKSQYYYEGYFANGQKQGEGRILNLVELDGYDS